VQRFEAELGAAFGERHAVACNSGTTAVELGLRALGARRGTTLLTPALAPVMTGLPAVTVGGRLVLFDCSHNAVHPDIEGLAAIDAPAGSILITVAWWGYLPDANVLRRLCDERGWWWLDDAAQAHGARYAPSTDGPAGPNVRCFSTHDRKLVTTGEGGFVLTADGEVARRARSYASYGGYPPGAADLVLGSEAGANLRLSALAAAMGIASLAALPDVIARRRHAASLIAAAHGALRWLTAHPVVDESAHNFYGLAFTVPEGLERHVGARYLAERGIQNDVIDYDLRPLYAYPQFHHARERPCPNAERLAHSLLMVSPHHGLTEENCMFIGATLRALDNEIDVRLSERN
jgi:dTDP-4-amino-4,6-dideoxygalactose transaminase